MEFLADWITNIILFILLATVVEMLLPNSSMQKYVKMVVGLLLIVIILTPLFQLLTQDFEQTFASLRVSPQNNEKNIENLIEIKKKEIQASNRAYILEEMAVQMKTEVEEEMVQEYGLTVEKVLLFPKEESIEITSPDDLSSIEVVLSKLDKDPNAVAVVKPVIIDTSKQTQIETNQPIVKEIASYLASIWGSNPEQIVVSVEGGKK
ncbi:stage III sporulation protein AF [Bacillus luteolus]|uniref:Stage III sporulation protein AF n=1 Tax=Litchfieldia luteola TaxID=682179 RepID=A0ABR9QPM4_9BACI|nr:stage III sporulation protein AF [Cytobacillus luteolus]MBE4910455.1 stage III sporulation protein AF [Cytobacillus luteolus]MBP1941969.1 stage III sporulation protein AF [Cytobacillus luteolus]